MTALRSALAVAAVAALGAAAHAQAPALRPVNGTIGTRPVATASPVPAMMMQQQLVWQNAYQQAQLWQMYQPPAPTVVINPVVSTWTTPALPVLNPNPWGPVVTVNPWRPVVNANPWGPTVTPNPWGPVVNQNPWGPNPVFRPNIWR